MVQITSSAILLFLLVYPSLAAPFPKNVDDIDLREFSNELVSRKIHIHLPKVHLPKIDGKKILDGLKKWGPKIGKTIFKIAKMVLREDIEARSFSVAERDVDGVDELYELLARSPKKSLKKLLKVVKKMKKYAKAGMQLAGPMEEDFGRRSLSFDSRDDDWENDIVARALEDSEIDARDLYLQLGYFERGLTHLIFEERGDWKIQGRDWDDSEMSGRDIDSFVESVHSRGEDVFFGGLDDLD